MSKEAKFSSGLYAIDLVRTHIEQYRLEGNVKACEVLEDLLSDDFLQSIDQERI